MSYLLGRAPEHMTTSARKPGAFGRRSASRSNRIRDDRHDETLDMSKTSTSILVLGGFLLLTFAVAAFGAAFPPGEWYANLNKPSWNPPNWVFGPVWTALYAMIAVAGWRICTRHGGFATPQMALWSVQLVLNGLWSWIFFGMHRPFLAFIEISLLWQAILGTIVLFAARDRLAAWLLGPYLAWVSFAAALNFEIWRLNA